jgi:hypothetical protein
VTATWDVHPCDLSSDCLYKGSAPYVPGKSPGNTDDPEQHGTTVYWEMWQVIDKKIYVYDPDFPLVKIERPQLTDTFGFSAKVAVGQDKTWGSYKQTGEMAFIPGKTKPPIGEAGKPGAWLPPDPKGPAGPNLWISDKSPTDWGNVKIQFTRSWNFSWNNCPGEKNFDASHPGGLLSPDGEHGGWR